MTFCCLNFVTGEFLWENLTLEEKWWVTLSHVGYETAVFTLYNDTSNPDNKSLIGVSVSSGKILWFRNNASMTDANDDFIVVNDVRLPGTQLWLRLEDGAVVENGDGNKSSSKIIKPVAYSEASPHFNVLKEFLALKASIIATHMIEYLEVERYIVISAYVQADTLANYLMVFSREGEVLQKEKLGERLKGIALDTFFIVSGYLFFVQNSNVLVSYKLV